MVTLPISIIEKHIFSVLAVLALAGASAYVDVKTSMATTEEKDQHQEEQLDRVERKIDKLVDRLLDQAEEE